MEDNVDWQLYDAHESATIYSDKVTTGGFLSTRRFNFNKEKDQMPELIKNQTQLEFHRLLTFAKSLQRQVDTLQENGGMLSKFQLVMIIVAVCFLIFNDLSDVMENETVAKIFGSFLILTLICYILRSHQLKVFTGMAEITKEKLLVSTVA